MLLYFLQKKPKKTKQPSSFMCFCLVFNTDKDLTFLLHEHNLARPMESTEFISCIQPIGRIWKLVR